MLILASGSMEKFLICLLNKYMLKPKLANTEREAVILNLIKRFPLQDINLLPLHKSRESAVTLDKRAVYICVENKRDPYLVYNINTLIFVVLHEMAHVGSNTWGHDSNFWKINKFLIDEAVECGIYKPINYLLSPEYYCNTLISYNPYFDDSIPELT
jgi:hypothetical protein